MCIRGRQRTMKRLHEHPLALAAWHDAFVGGRMHGIRRIDHISFRPCMANENAVEPRDGPEKLTACIWSQLHTDMDKLDTMFLYRKILEGISTGCSSCAGRARQCRRSGVTWSMAKALLSSLPTASHPFLRGSAWLGAGGEWFVCWRCSTSFSHISSAPRPARYAEVDRGSRLSRVPIPAHNEALCYHEDICSTPRCSSDGRYVTGCRSPILFPALTC